MDNETVASFAFMFFGLGFYLLIFRVIMNDDRSNTDRSDRIRAGDDLTEQRSYERMQNEAREFGYEGSRLQSYIKENSTKTTSKKK